MVVSQSKAWLSLMLCQIMANLKEGSGIPMQD